MGSADGCVFQRVDIMDGSALQHMDNVDGHAFWYVNIMDRHAFQRVDNMDGCMFWRMDPQYVTNNSDMYTLPFVCWNATGWLLKPKQPLKQLNVLGTQPAIRAYPPDTR